MIWAILDVCAIRFQLSIGEISYTAASQQRVMNIQVLTLQARDVQARGLNIKIS